MGADSLMVELVSSSSCADEIEVEIARLGGLRQVLELLSFPDAEVQRRALAALCNLSISGEPVL